MPPRASAEVSLRHDHPHASGLGGNSFHAPIVAYGAPHSHDVTSIQSLFDSGPVGPKAQNVAQNSLQPGLTQQRINFFETKAAASKTGGSAPELWVQEARPVEQNKAVMSSHAFIDKDRSDACGTLNIARKPGPSFGPTNYSRPMEIPNLLQLHAAAEDGTTPEQVPEEGPEVQNAQNSSCPVFGQSNVLQNPAAEPFTPWNAPHSMFNVPFDAHSVLPGLVMPRFALSNSSGAASNASGSCLLSSRASAEATPRRDHPHASGFGGNSIQSPTVAQGMALAPGLASLQSNFDSLRTKALRVRAFINNDVSNACGTLSSAQNSGPSIGPMNFSRPTEIPNLLQQNAAAKIGTTPKLVPEVGPKVQSAHLPCSLSGQPNVLQSAGQINVLAGISMQEFMENDSMQITFVHPYSGISMQELIDFDSMPVAVFALSSHFLVSQKISNITWMEIFA